MGISKNDYWKSGYEGHDFQRPYGSYNDYRDAKRQYENGVEEKKALHSHIKMVTDYSSKDKKFETSSYGVESDASLFLKEWAFYTLMMFLIFALLDFRIFSFGSIIVLSVVFALLLIIVKRHFDKWTNKLLSKIKRKMGETPFGRFLTKI